MRLFSRDKPKIKVETEKADGFSGWLKCTCCHEMIHKNELGENLNCCPKCGSHYRISARERIDLLSDAGSFKELFANLRSVDTLGFVDSKRYLDRLEEAKRKSGEGDAIITGECEVGGIRSCLAVMNFAFMAGSMGSVVGEKLTRLIEHALDKRLPLVVVSASGGARMQESTLSLMQMAKTSAALSRLHKAGVPYISILTNPTSGGVTASFAALGDVIIAEPDALICFAGPRVVEQVIREKLPPGAQRSEFLLEHGMIDMIAKREELKQKLHQTLDFLTGNERKYSSKQKMTSDEITQKLQELFSHAKTPCKNER
ncbi:MAG: Acetyl-coenzyme A carboxylase carboxyl transferase subunit beta [Chlamydiales bacterium]|nr:Acetyl-coenzyme A carboxylase carboxyl transferase subunit beta [Chlamydiales bacterium]MCH9635487.1 Acetyl-coenzyme A carboxylase carboxyl transferase subunit beta [Chlamydiales bacterium]MCH9704011.1 acetyl-CoA carboxylase, carboxyltransferase subunit beta [Chlamydiota bacterium]